MEKQFKAGDLVWAKVHRYPWWPAAIYHEDLSSLQIRQTKKEGFVLVSFYGDNSYKWLNPKEVLPFESNFSSYSERCRSQLFVKAVNEAVDEVNHRAAIGMTCPCKFFAHYRSTPVKDLLEVDTDGYKLGGVYAVNQIESFRQEFSPLEMLSFVQKLAVDLTDLNQNLRHSKEVARALVYRKTRYAKIDEPYFEAFQVDPKKLGDSIVASDNQKTSLIQDHPLYAESQRRKNSKSAPWKNKLHATKPKQSGNKNKPQNSNTKSSEDRVSKKKRSKQVIEEKLVVRSSTASVKEQPSSKDEGKKKLVFSSSSTTHVKEQQSVPCSKHDSPPAPKQMKKRTTPPAFSFQNRRNAGESNEMVNYSSWTEASRTDMNLGHNKPQDDTPVNPIVAHYQEIYAEYREEAAKRTHVQVDDGGIDISEKMLFLLNECNRIVRELQ